MWIKFAKLIFSSVTINFNELQVCWCWCTRLSNCPNSADVKKKKKKKKRKLSYQGKMRVELYKCICTWCCKQSAENNKICRFISFNNAFQVYDMNEESRDENTKTIDREPVHWMWICQEFGKWVNGMKQKRRRKRTEHEKPNKQQPLSEYLKK